MIVSPMLLKTANLSNDSFSEVEYFEPVTGLFAAPGSSVIAATGLAVIYFVLKYRLSRPYLKIALGFTLPALIIGFIVANGSGMVSQLVHDVF